MAEGVRRQQASAWRALDESLLDQERLDDFLDRIARLRQRRRDGLDPDRTAAVVLGDVEEVAPIHGVEPGGVDFEREQRTVRERTVDCAGTPYEREIAHAAQEPAGDPRRAAGAARDLVRAIRAHSDAEHARAAVDDLLQLRLGIEIEPHRNAKTIPQRI